MNFPHLTQRRCRRFRARFLAASILLFASALVHSGAKSASPQTPSPLLVAAVLPGSRSVQIGSPATFFATIINAGGAAAVKVGISLKTAIPASLTFQTTDSSTNAVTGAPNMPVDIPAGQRQAFVVVITPTAAFSPTVVEFNFSGGDTPAANTVIGINTLLLSSSAAAVPDILTLPVTVTRDGTVNLSVSGAVAMARATVDPLGKVQGPRGSGSISVTMSEAFAVATVNVGSAGDTITAEVGTHGVSLPVTLSVQETDPATGAITGSNVKSMAPGQTASFAIFAAATGPIPFDPLVNRIFVDFKDSPGVVRGSTSVAISTQRGDLIVKGAELFFNEKFDGNGRTCATCHPADNNLTLDPAFIATLPPGDPLFVAEFNPALAQLENPKLMREFALILENVDGFDRPGVMRGVPHTLALSTSVASSAGPRTGWSGDGAPGDGSLRSFSTGAVTQHFTKTLNRVPGIDFRLPTDSELDAMEAFMLSLGRQADLSLPLPLKGTVSKRGQAIFLDNSLGKCNLCHRNAGASVNLGTGNQGNVNFNTGVETLPDQPARLTSEVVPVDGGFGKDPRASGGFGDGSFNPPPLVEAANTGPFFHNNSVRTIEEAVAFYNSAAFNTSSAAGEIGGGISLDTTQVEAVAGFLRVLNALENIRSAVQFQQSALQTSDALLITRLLQLAERNLADAISVLEGGGLHPTAVALLEDAKSLTTAQRIQAAIAKTTSVRDQLRDP